jgi:lysophospholipase L1-like esterase
VHDPLLDPVCEAPRVEPVLEAAAAVVVDAHAEMMRPDATEVHVAAIGDSITAGSPWDDDPEIGWPPAAAAADPRLRFTVRAVYGKRTDEIAAWLDEAAAGAEALVVQGGINDIAQGRTVAEAAANLRAMIARGQVLGLQVAVADVLPWNNGWPHSEPAIRELNAAIEEMGVPVLPFHDTLEDRNRPGRMREDWTIEGDHPSIEGYRRLGELAFRLP